MGDHGETPGAGTETDRPNQTISLRMTYESRTNL